MAKVITIKIETESTQQEVKKVFTVDENDQFYPVEIEEFLVEHVGERPSREERR